MMGTGTVAMWNAVLGRIALDYAVVFQRESVAGETWQADENGYLAGVCKSLSESVFGGDEGDLLRAALGMEGEEEAARPPPAKRARKAGVKAKKGKAAGAPAAEGGYSGLSALLAARDENSISFDCHVAVRRWAVLAFGWL